MLADINESSICSYASKMNDAVKHAKSVCLSSALSEKPEDEQHIFRASSSSLNYDNRNVSISSDSKNKLNLYNCSVNIINQ